MRKTETITITDDGRDKGKMFLLTEMPAEKAEKWALRAFLALARSGVELPDDVQQLGMAGMAIVGLRALGGVQFSDAEELLDEMFECVQIMPDPGKPHIIRRPTTDDIEEIPTRLKLRTEVFKLHTGFLPAGLGQMSTSEIPAVKSSSTTPTSHPPSERASHPARQRSPNSKQFTG